jgi:HK97 family phage prohead protease
MDLTQMPALPPEIQRVLDREPRQVMARVRGLELRDATGTGDGSYTLSGVAAVFGQTTTLYRGKWWTLEEEIAPGAFSAVLARPPDVHLNHGHDMRTAMARLTHGGPDGPVKVGGMKLWEEDDGLHVFARLNPDLSHVRDLAVQMADGVVDQMSFKFEIGRDVLRTTVDPATGHETDHYTIIEVSELYDVCVCAQGAYPQTSASLRAALASLRHSGIDPEGLRPRHTPARVGDHHATTPPADGDLARAAQLAAIRARARVASLTTRR